MSHKPTGLQENANRSESEMSKNVLSHQSPNFMMSLYQIFRHSETRQSIEMRPDALQRTPSAPQADIIRSLAAKVVELEQTTDRCILVFDFSSLNYDEELQYAEVRFGRSLMPKSLSDGMTLKVDIFHQDATCHDAHEICQNYVYLGSTSTCKTRSTESWQVLETTAIVHKWFERKERVDANTAVGLKVGEKAYRVNAKRRFREQKSEDQQVLMFVYSNMSKKEKSSVTATLLLDATQSKYLATIPFLRNIASRRSKRSLMIRDRIKDLNKVPVANSENNLCRRVDFIVDFRVIGWGAWIIHPKKFNAYRCEGTCPSPVNENLRPNNHSYMQSLLNLYHGEKAPEVCCVPVKMSSLSMAYYDAIDVTFQTHEAMIVEECGCQ
ncbi:nodal homolog 4-A-like [Hyperolius riggenbachi]|uniref:nodal homolog 4-A-like n=1 Tax=Hyperolius riggenbachi TaxID=752182 RepID=UPI0035A2EB4E